MLVPLQIYLMIGAQPFQLGENCNQPTFQNTPVKFNQNTEIPVIGCITPKVLPFFSQYNQQEGLEINIENQNIESINKRAVADFPGKLYIQFNFNQINMVKKNAFVNLPYLLQLHLDNNGISTIEAAAFTNLPSLTYIRLSNNQIGSLDVGTFQNLLELIGVELDHNRLTVFNKEWFKNTPKLSSLTLANNLIRTIPRRAFDSIHKIWNLDFTSNEIEYIDKDAFYGLSQLKILLLGNNRLQTLNVNLGSLETLIVHQNNITYIPEAVLRATENTIKVFSLYGNPLQCPCFDKVVRWSQEHNITDPFVNPSSSDNLVCVSLSDHPTECMENLNEEAAGELHKLFHKTYMVL